MHNQLILAHNLAESGLQADTSSLATKNDISALKLEINTLELKLEQAKSDLIKWVAGLLIAQGGVIVALIKILP